MPGGSTRRYLIKKHQNNAPGWCWRDWLGPWSRSHMQLSLITGAVDSEGASRCSCRKCDWLKTLTCTPMHVKFPCREWIIKQEATGSHWVADVMLICLMAAADLHPSTLCCLAAVWWKISVWLKCKHTHTCTRAHTHTHTLKGGIGV